MDNYDFRWEQYYKECCDKDFKERIYQECDKEDAAE